MPNLSTEAAEEILAALKFCVVEMNRVRSGFTDGIPNELSTLIPEAIQDAHKAMRALSCAINTKVG